MTAGKGRTVRTTLLWSALMVVLSTAACATTPEDVPARFGGAWGVDWCDPASPAADCGGFTVFLQQEGDVVCGSYTGARLRLTQVDEGGARAIVGLVSGKSAVLTIESARSGGIYLIHATRDADELNWQLRTTVRRADADIDIIAGDEQLIRRGPEEPSTEWQRGVVKDCASATR